MWPTRARRSRSRAFPIDAKLLAGVFWPGPLTLVLPKADGCPVSELATAGLDSIAVRVPDHPIARDLLKAFGKPVVAPSANRSGHVSPTIAAACARRSRRPHRSDHRWRAGERRRRVDHRVMPRRADPAAARAACRATRSSACSATRSLDRRTAIRRGTARARHARLALRAETPLRLNAATCEPGEALLAFGPDARRRRDALNLSRQAISSRPPRICSRICARSMPPARAASP